MGRKDMGLAVLVLTVGAVVALINPRFLSAVNLANTANLIGLFGLFSIAEAFAIARGSDRLRCDLFCHVHTVGPALVSW